jgi:hypothetical protein
MRRSGNKPREFTRLTQHFFFFLKRKPVLKEKTKSTLDLIIKKSFIENGVEGNED